MLICLHSCKRLTCSSCMIDTRPDLAASAVNSLATPSGQMRVLALNHFTAELVLYFRVRFLESEECLRICRNDPYVSINCENRGVYRVEQISDSNPVCLNKLGAALAYPMSYQASIVGFVIQRFATPGANASQESIYLQIKQGQLRERFSHSFDERSITFMGSEECFLPFHFPCPAKYIILIESTFRFMAGVTRMGRTLTSCAPIFAAVFLFASAVDGIPAFAAPPGPGKIIWVGFSQTDNLNPWRVAETNSIRKETEARGCALLYRDAGGSVQKQIEDLTFLISKKVDYIILVPREFDAFGPQLQAARRAGIPVILIDRGAEGTPGRDYVTLIASNFIQEGERAASWLAQKTAGRATIVELLGTAGSTPVIDRAKGFRNVISLHPGMKIIASESGDFLRTQGQKAMEGIILSAGRRMTAVFAHNDEMAIGAIQALKAAGMVPGRDVILVSIDGERDALKAIVAGELGASIECNPRFGSKALDVIEALRRGEKVPESIVIPDLFFDRQNALEYIDKAF